MPTNRTDIPGVIAPPPLIYLGCLAVGWGLSQVLPDAGLPLSEPVRSWLAFGLVSVGALIAGLAAGVFRSLGTRPEPWRPSTALATDGIFRFTRNPMYLGFALAYAGVAVALDSLWALALLIPCLAVMDVLVIRREERYLSRLFGADYDAYRRKVRRWL